jgi:hypothetical protein
MRLDDGVKCSVQSLHDAFGVEVLGHGGDALDVGEDRDDAPFLARRVAIPVMLDKVAVQLGPCRGYNVLAQHRAVRG